MKVFEDLQAEGFAKYFYQLAEKSDDVFWIRSVDQTKLLYVNAAYEKVWGRRKQSLYNDPALWITTLVLEDRIEIQQKFDALASPFLGDMHEINYRIVRPDNSLRLIKETFFPIFNNQGKCFAYAGIAKDITMEMSREKDQLKSQELEKAKLRAEAANQAKSNFLAMMSHELRTPLNAILGMAQIIKMKGMVTSLEAEECVQTIANAGNNLLGLLNDILDFVTLEVGEVSFYNEPFDLRIMVLQVIASFELVAKEKGLDLRTSLAKHESMLVVGDAKRIRQILVNLVTNAIKFTEKGCILIHVECFSQENKKGLYKFIISDTGVGISSDKLTFIFEKFSKVDSSYQRRQAGLGLGLAICKELVERMGGTIHVKSQTGQGSEFVVEMPLLMQKSFAEMSVIAPPTIMHEEAKPSSLAVLVVEDNPINQKIIKIMLEEANCKVHIVDNGKEVLENIHNINDYDLILMDIGLPDISGIDVVKELRSRIQPNTCSVPILALTAHILESDKQKFFACGMNGIIEKPVNQKELLLVLKYWSSQGALKKSS